MTRLLDLGIDRIRNIIRDMAGLSEQSVFTSIESYNKGTSVKNVGKEVQTLFLISSKDDNNKDVKLYLEPYLIL